MRAPSYFKASWMRGDWAISACTDKAVRAHNSHRSPTTVSGCYDRAIWLRQALIVIRARFYLARSERPDRPGSKEQ